MAAKLPSLDLVYDSVQKRLDLQFEQVDALDTKANIVLAAAGIILAALIGFSAQRSLTPTIVLPIGVAFVVLSALLSVKALWVRQFERPPHLERLRDYYIVQAVEETKLMVIDVSLEAVANNHAIIRTKIRDTVAAFFFLFLGVLTTGSYLVILSFRDS